MGLLGANNYYTTKVALRKSQLNLGAWHGFQGVIYKERVDPEEIEFDFLLTEGAYIYFIINKDPERFTAVRFSANEAFRNMIVTGSDAGEFLDKTELQIDSIKKDTWNHLKVKFGNDKYTLFLNEKLVGSFSEVLLQKQYFGFKGSYNHAFVDNILVKQIKSNEIIEESFSNTTNRNKYLLLIFAVLFILNVGISLLLMFKEEEFKKIAFTSIMFNVLVLMMSISLLFIYYYKNELKLRYPELHGAYKNLMTKERVYTNTDLNYVNNQILNSYKPLISPDIQRILFVGTSQTRGAGARTQEETLVRVTEEILNREEAGRFECINAGVHGMKSKGLLGFYEEKWTTLNPDVTVINLSNNDNDAEVFRASLEKFIDINKAKGIRTVFVLEANSRETGFELHVYHKIMREVGEKNGIFIIDLHNYLLERYDEGILWWDGVHMTSYGQRLAAEFISAKLLNIQ